MSPRAHSRLGASVAKRWLNCPGSVALCASLPEPEPGLAAREGTAAHAWAEYALKNGEVDISGYVGAECPDATLAEFPPLKADMASAVNVYLDHVWSVLAPEDELHAERRFSLEFIAPGMFGTNDCCVIKPDGTLHVIDYKHGAGVYVDAEDNEQLKYYALGALETFRAEHKIKRVVTTIVQPRCSGEAVRSAEYAAVDIWEFGLELREGEGRTRDPNAPCIPGSWCTFCPGTKGACKAFENRALSAAQDGFGEIVEPAISEMSVEELGDRLAKCDLLDLWLKRFREYAEARARSGDIPRGFKFVSGRGRRAWSKTDDEIIAIIGDEAKDVSAKSVAQLEKAIGKTRFREFAGLVTTRYSRPQLVNETDRRPALSLLEVNASSADGFETIEG